MTENNEFEKAAFLTSYWGVNCVCNDKYPSIVNQTIDAVLSIYNGSLKSWYAKLRPLSSMNAGEAIKIALIKYPNSVGSEVTGRRVAENHQNHSREVADELRKMGFLIAWRDLSIEQIKAYGWAKT